MQPPPAGLPAVPEKAAALHPRRATINWLDVLFLFFLAGLAVIPPINEWHKQITLLAIGFVQLFEGQIVARVPGRGRAYVVLIKIALASLLIAHTGEQVAINSSYYPIYYIPIITAAVYFGPWGSLFWTFLSAAAYCSYLFPALAEFSLEESDLVELATRILFFFFIGVIVNRLVIQYRREAERSHAAAEALAETNRQLENAQAEARRSERLAALGQMSAGLAHEIRNPLGVIKGSAEMLQQKVEGTNPLASEMAEYIYSEVNRLSSFVTRFLDFARPEKLALARSSITEILDRALDNVRERYPDARVVVMRDYEPDIPEIFVDAQLCESAFTNLIQNAYEAMGAPGGDLRVSATEENEKLQDGIAIRIEDTGPGIPAELREQIFNPFVTTKKTGTGLGLSIVSKVVDEHHGSIRIERGSKGGTRFVI
ncbi:MAG TPA: ATP-binding protein, partial [Candidatus Acidoferrales bacterium]|nr:ATP-binding protein [Candidatus Acidoferrales bacterium]